MIKVSALLDIYFDGSVKCDPVGCEESLREIMDNIFKGEQSYIKTDAKVAVMREVVE